VYAIARSLRQTDRPAEELSVVLVLTRRGGQSIIIGDDIELTVLSIEGNKVRLGIQAPLSVPVHRTEIYLQIHASDDENADLEPDAAYDEPTRRAS
jgi:carbon storage regulator